MSILAQHDPVFGFVLFCFSFRVLSPAVTRGGSSRSGNFDCSATILVTVGASYFFFRVFFRSTAAVLERTKRGVFRQSRYFDGARAGGADENIDP